MGQQRYSQFSGPVALVPPGVSPARQARGRVAALSGIMAEDSVQRLFVARGARLLASRWRGRAGEIDLIFAEGEDLVFVEVKKAATHGLAAERLRPSQMARICRAALEYCERSGMGSPCFMRFDVALVDQQGRIELLQNAFGEM